MRTPGLKAILLAFILLLLVCAGGGCLPETPGNMDWAAPEEAIQSSPDAEIQDMLNDYSASLVSKDKQRFLSFVDQNNAAFYEQQKNLFDNLADVPLDRYRIDLDSRIDTGEETAVIKVSMFSTLMDSFPEFPEPVKAAFSVVKKDNGWKLASENTEETMGRKRNAQLEDFGKVEVIEGNNVIVLYHAGEKNTALKAETYAEEAFPKLLSAIPGTGLPKVPIRVFADKQQIDLAFPGQWQEWVGGASRQLGEDKDQGGEIVLNSEVFSEVAVAAPEYNRQMIAHELTHIALFPKMGIRTPPFLIEGLADYVAGIESSSLLRTKLRSNEEFSPTLRDIYRPAGFDMLISQEAAQLAYEEADSAVAFLEQTYGNESVLNLLDEFKRREREDIDQDLLVDEVFKSVLGISWDEFEKAWRQYVLSG